MAPSLADRALLKTLEAHTQRAVRDALARGDKVAAIKLVREATGLGLAEAKAAVEALDQPDAPPLKTLSDEDDARIKALLRDGNQQDAIRVFRKATGLQLKTSYEAVRAHADYVRQGGTQKIAVPVEIPEDGTVKRQPGGLRSLVQLLVFAAVVGAVLVAVFGWPR